jgi:hypothetical protein
MRREMKRHPSRFDRSTAEERCFLRLPAAARVAIEKAVRDAWQTERKAWRGERRKFSIVDYFERGRKARQSLGVPPSLREIVWKAVGHLDKVLQAAVRRVCRRHLSKWRGARQPTKKEARELGLPDGSETGGGQRRHRYVDVTPLPALGRPSE